MTSERLWVRFYDVGEFLAELALSKHEVQGEFVRMVTLWQSGGSVQDSMILTASVVLHGDGTILHLRETICSYIGTPDEKQRAAVALAEKKLAAGIKALGLTVRSGYLDPKR